MGLRYAEPLGDHTIGPFHKRDKDRRIAKLRSPIIQIGLYDGPCPIAVAACVDRNVSCGNLGEGLFKRCPAERYHCAGNRLAHQRDGLSQQDDLDGVSGFRQRKSVEKRKRRLRRVI